jgi:hypothetical protein
MQIGGEPKSKDRLRLQLCGALPARKGQGYIERRCTEQVDQAYIASLSSTIQKIRREFNHYCSIKFVLAVR